MVVALSDLEFGGGLCKEGHSEPWNEEFLDVGQGEEHMAKDPKRS